MDTERSGICLLRWILPVAVILAGILPACNARVDPVPPPRIPIEDFLREPVGHSYRLSPDGESYTWLSRVNGRTHLFRRVLNGVAVDDITPSDMSTVNDYLWLTGGQIFALGSGIEGILGITLLQAGDRAGVAVLSGEGSCEIIDPLPELPQHIAVLFSPGEDVPRPRRDGRSRLSRPAPRAPGA